MAEVYVLRPTTFQMYFKVGVTDQLPVRLRQLRKHEYRSLECVLVTQIDMPRETAIDLERAIHSDLNSYRVGREWFVAPFWRVLTAVERSKGKILYGHDEPPGWSINENDAQFVKNLEALCGVAGVRHG